MLAAGAPIDGFGVGTALTTSSDAPALDAVYKLQIYAGQPRRKRSEGKATWPGIKQVCRFVGDDGRLLLDRLQLADESCAGLALLQPVMRGGQRIGKTPLLGESRSYCAAQLASLPQALHELDAPAQPYRVEVSQALQALARRFDATVH